VRSLAIALVACAGCAGVFGLADKPDDAEGDPSLLLHLSLDEVGPVTSCAADSSGHHHDASCADPLPTLANGPGPTKAFRFTPNTAALTVASAPELEERVHFTAAAWVNHDKLQLTAGCPINFRLGTTNVEDAWQLCVDAADSWFVRVSDGTRAVQANFSPSPTDKTWSHVALVFDAGTVTGYLNGAPAAGPMDNAPIDYQAGGAILIGADLDPGVSTDLEFDGSIDDVRFYNRALTSAELQDIGGEDL
jgi:hypothetical protein